MQRILLFVATNFAVLLVLGLVTSLLGLDRNSQAGLLVMALIMGFGGSTISLLLSKTIAMRSMGVRLINEPSNRDEAWIVETVRGFADKAGIQMPDVGIYDGPPNAFATGARKNAALVAVSTGLLQSMTHEEVEAVIGHEVAHVANGDMVTMTLIQGVMNTFVIYISRVVGMIVDGFLRGASQNEQQSSHQTGMGVGYYVTVFIMDALLGVLAAIIVAWFSRQREFRADAGAAQMMGQSLSMQKALARLGGASVPDLPQGMASMGIFGSVGMLFSSHPPLETRIAALQKLSV
ncbi:protease HtpX [Allofranklinella schreckenbergeri]|uniref:Protease HtpX homolog n=1 Tax=Allofranklinella schreckenbergeri TaxID=1076744 RepID=A0A3M6Q5J2_9BURK|nr:protease HtpX [Allofranklinella schreckenbergeri]RMW97658.1 protease HtpX [Allofranklinella schreckenbergeri]RMX02740.1 protease HtpX [Allofranklinella schreckenbergeri]RMX11379.1 protease HtpX [Allofranklinella schreckenbergeri]RRD44232.1 protease HtpX [Comamonadaceae bacterium OH3737_COT-264]